MNLKQFLKEVNGVESDIIEYKGKKALEAVKKSGYDLQYIKEQTPEICLEAVKRDGHALQYIKEQTPEICLEAVKENGHALQYVDKGVFESSVDELTLEEICKELGREVKIVK